VCVVPDKVVYCDLILIDAVEVHCPRHLSPMLGQSPGEAIRDRR
jgi:hypothetical protein